MQAALAAAAFWLPAAPTPPGEETQIFTALQMWIGTGTSLPEGYTAAMKMNVFIWLCKFSTSPAAVIISSRPRFAKRLPNQAEDTIPAPWSHE